LLDVVDVVFQFLSCSLHFLEPSKGQIPPQIRLAGQNIKFHLSEGSSSLSCENICLASHYRFSRFFVGLAIRVSSVLFLDHYCSIFPADDPISLVIDPC